MSTALFEDFECLTKGDKTTFYYQELNPPDRSKVKLLEIDWTHDSIDGDLILGSMNIQELGSFDLDAYVYRNSVIRRPNGVDSAWLSPVNARAALNDDSLYNLTGGPLSKRKLLPSEISTPSGPRKGFSGSSGSRVMCFSREEQAIILKWQRGMNEKGFRSDFPDETYVEYKRALWHSLASNIEKGGLNGNIEICRFRSGLFKKSYSLSASDDSFRRSRVNPEVKYARPSFTTYMLEDCNSFDELLTLMDKAVDTLVQRNERYMS